MTETAHWSFICGNGTIFDQQILTCNYPQDSLPCDQAEAFYNLVEFGKIGGLGEYLNLGHLVRDCSIGTAPSSHRSS